MTGRGRHTVVLDLRGLHWASQQAVASSVLGRRAGVVDVTVNPVSQSATVVFDPMVTSVAELRAWVQECGYHCTGQLVPNQLCDPAEEPADAPATSPAAHGGNPDHRGYRPQRPYARGVIRWAAGLSLRRSR